MLPPFRPSARFELRVIDTSTDDCQRRDVDAVRFQQINYIKMQVLNSAFAAVAFANNIHADIIKYTIGKSH